LIGVTAKRQCDESFEDNVLARDRRIFDASVLPDIA
jgi:hypothetical protein